MDRRLLIILCGMVLSFAGCGSEEKEPIADTGVPAAKNTAGSKKTKPWDPTLGTATISGMVKFTGKMPRRRPIDMGGRVECAKLHSEPVLDDTIIVGDDGSLKNAFVWIKKGLREWDFPAPEESALIDQQGCIFVPHVQGVRVGQKVVIRNSDPFVHNVHSFSLLNSAFNFGQPAAGQEDIKVFNRKEFIRIKCDIHGWMTCHVMVVPHPYFSVTGDDGNFTLPKLPSGSYTVEAWHEEFGQLTQKVKIDENENQVVDFAFQN